MNRATRRKLAKQQQAPNQGAIARRTVTKSPAQIRAQQTTQTLMQAAKALQQGELAQADALCQQILKYQPKQHDALQLRGLLSHQKGALQLAKSQLSESLNSNPNQSHVWHNYAKVLSDMGEMDAALAANDRAIKANADNVEAYYNRANLLTRLLRFDEAIADYQRALELKPDYGAAKLNLALSYREIGQVERSADVLTELVEQEPNNSEYRRSLALMLRDLGRKKDAKEQLEAAMELDPTNVHNYYDFTLLQKFHDIHRPMIRTMETMLAEVEAEKTDEAVPAGHYSIPQQRGVKLHFGLGKAYDDLREDAKAFEHYDAANALVRGQTDYSTQRVERYFERIEQQFNADFFAKHTATVDAAPKTEQTPIFIVGMPRSGTSLVEQIIASHSRVTGAGEPSDLHFCVTGNPWEKRPDYLTVVGDQPTEDFLTQGQHYLSQLKRISGDTPYFCDKMPGNFHYVGMIRVMFPHAKVIHCVRNPLDTCLSIYKRLFFGRHPYAYNQQELAEHYVQYRQLMTHWNQMLPGFIHEVRYEDVVNDTKAQTEQLLTFCELPWEKDCLNFHQSKRAVHTASALQVRQPIYRDAMGGWKRYIPHIGAMIEVFDQQTDML